MTKKMKKGAALTRIARLKTVRLEAINTVDQFRYDNTNAAAVADARSVSGSCEKELADLQVAVAISNAVEMIEKQAVLEVLFRRQEVNLKIDRLKLFLVYSDANVEQRRVAGEYVQVVTPSLIERGAVAAQLQVARRLAASLDELIQEHNWSTDIEVE